MNILDKALLELKSFSDKVFICPLEENEISEIESKLKKKLPIHYKDFLRKVGLKQDFIQGLLYAVKHFDDVSEFINSKNYFKFGDNGGEDYWLLKFDEGKDKTIYQYDYWNNFEIESLNKTFDDLVLENLNRIKSNPENLTPNNQKRWWVDFSLNTGSGKFLVNSLKERGIDIELLKEPLKKKVNGKIEYEDGLIKIEEKEIILKKWTYSGQSLSFIWQENLEDIKTNSTVKRIQSALKTCEFSHTLGDGGILSIR